MIPWYLHIALQLMVVTVAIVGILRLKRENADLRQALVAKRVLLDQDIYAIPPGVMVSKPLAAGDTLDVKFSAPVVRVRIEPDSAARISVTAFA
jgi:hypothetical protein